MNELALFPLPYGGNSYLEAYKKGDLIRAIQQLPERINLRTGAIGQNQTDHYKLQLGFSYEILSIWTDLNQATEQDAISFEINIAGQFLTRFSLGASEIPCNLPYNAIDGKLPYSVKITPSKAIDSLILCIRRIAPIQILNLEIFP